MLQHRLRASLLFAQAVAVMTLLRSIAYDRWITVLASLVMIAGASAALRGRTWGVGLALASAAAFPVAFAIGIAPPWFCLVGLAGALPFALTARPLARFDKGATVLLGAVAAMVGAGAAIAFKEAAWSIFTTFPSLRPSIEAQHGVALAATLAVVVGALAGRARHPAAREAYDGERARVRFGDRVRIGGEQQQQRQQQQGDALDEARRELDLDDVAHRTSMEPLLSQKTPRRS